MHPKMSFHIASAIASSFVTACAVYAQQNELEPHLPISIVSADDPAHALGRRVLEQENQRSVAPVLIIAEDSAAYLEAISEWTPEVYFPVLIDNGTDTAREHIARFTRAFQPEEIYLLASPNGLPETVPSWPGQADAMASIAKAWDVDGDDLSNAELLAAWSAKETDPLGVVAAHKGHASWPAAVALAAGRGQVTIWLDAPGGGDLNRRRSIADIRQVDQLIREELTELGLEHNGMGDTIDAVTLVSNDGVAALGLDSKPRAITDIIGRLSDNARWAWTGQIVGDEAQSSYMAMTALFLKPDSTWAFDGYGSSFDRYGYSISGVRDIAAEAGFEAEVHAAGTAEQWRTVTKGGIDGGIALVNSSGQSKWFQLSGSKAYTFDVPQLLEPTLVHFIHSYSAQRIGDTNTIAARWMENGAYAYVGAVDEPKLYGFRPNDEFLGLLLQSQPFGAVARTHDFKADEPWKVATFGDPLLTLAEGIRTKAPATFNMEAVFPTARTLANEVANTDATLADRLVRLAVMSGNDQLAIQYATSQTETDTINPSLAQQLLHASEREEDPSLIAELYRVLSQDVASEHGNVALLWRTWWEQLSSSTGSLPQSAVALLKEKLPAEARMAAITTLIPSLIEHYGQDETVAYLITQAELETNSNNQQQLLSLAGVESDSTDAPEINPSGQQVAPLSATIVQGGMSASPASGSIGSLITITLDDASACDFTANTEVLWEGLYREPGGTETQTFKIRWSAPLTTLTAPFTSSFSARAIQVIVGDGASINAPAPYTLQPGGVFDGSFTVTTSGRGADWNGDGYADIFDVLAYLNDVSSGNIDADINGSGTIDAADLSLFLSVFDPNSPCQLPESRQIPFVYSLATPQFGFATIDYPLGSTAFGSGPSDPIFAADGSSVDLGTGLFILDTANIELGQSLSFESARSVSTYHYTVNANIEFNAATDSFALNGGFIVGRITTLNQANQVIDSTQVFLDPIGLTPDLSSIIFASELTRPVFLVNDKSRVDNDVLTGFYLLEAVESGRVLLEAE